MSKSVGVKKKSIWRDKASWELLILCVPTLLAFTLFHYVPMHHIAVQALYAGEGSLRQSLGRL